MGWKEISNFSNIITILGAVFSGIAWYKTKKYYSKISKNNSFEKLSSLDQNLLDIRSFYNDIKKFHFMINKRGKDLQEIIDCHLKIDKKLNNIRNILPSKYKGILNSISIANEKINNINEKKLYCQSNEDFKELGTYLTNIEDGVKSEKEKIRGF